MDMPKILIVDDEPEARASIKSFLSRRIEGDIQEACDGRQALEMVDKDSVDLLVLDVKMPGISGIDVLKKVKTKYPHIDVLMVTAYDSHQITREVLKHGAVDCIIKPSTLDVIFEKVKEILQSRKQYLPKEKKSS